MTTDHPLPSKPRRRWFQFSLRTMFVLMTVLCVWLAVTVNRASKQRRAVAAIRELGGTVYYDYQINRGKEPPGPKWLRELVGEEYFVSVVDVDINGPYPQVTDADLVHLKGFTKLETLNIINNRLINTRITGAGLEHLKGLTNLKLLNLSGTKVTDAGLEHLKGFTNLWKINLLETQVTDEGIKKLQQALPNCAIQR